ncbi:MAG: hypothetical protein ACI8T1_003410 [Verrucomicrobiales bacterium]|jgi:hypothetical protein
MPFVWINGNVRKTGNVVGIDGHHRGKAFGAIRIFAQLKVVGETASAAILDEDALGVTPLRGVVRKVAVAEPESDLMLPLRVVGEGKQRGGLDGIVLSATEGDPSTVLRFRGVESEPGSRRRAASIDETEIRVRVVGRRGAGISGDTREQIELLHGEWVALDSC